MKVMKRKNNKIRWSDESGMTLVEVLVAIALISMIVTTFLSFFIQAARPKQIIEPVISIVRRSSHKHT